MQPVTPGLFGAEMRGSLGLAASLAKTFSDLCIYIYSGAHVHHRHTRKKGATGFREHFQFSIYSETSLRAFQVFKVFESFEEWPLRVLQDMKVLCHCHTSLTTSFPLDSQDVLTYEYGAETLVSPVVKAKARLSSNRGDGLAILTFYSSGMTTSTVSLRLIDAKASIVTETKTLCH